MARSFTIPDFKDDKGRVPRGAIIKAYRTDTHLYVEEAEVNSSGNATFSSLPEGVDVSFHATWGGTTLGKKERWFYSHINAVSEGGTGASDAATARTNLGVGTGDSPQFDEINLGHATDTTITRVSAAKVSIEGTNIVRPANYVVAASNAPTHVKAQADRTCSGTDDHVDIQAVIDLLPATGGKVLLTEGTFNVESAITLDSKQTLQGMGWNTILTTSTSYLKFLTATGSSGSEKTGIFISDLQIDGTDSGGIDVGIEFDYVDDSLIQNVYSHGFSDGSVGAGIMIIDSDFTIVTRNLCTSNLAGIEISSGDNTLITQNTCRSNTYGMWLYGADYNIVSLNSVRLSGAHGIYLETSNHNALSINTCTENGQDTDDTYDDINLNASDYNNIQGNICRAGGETNKPRYGINISGATCDGNKVINNDLYDDGFVTAPFNDSGTGTIYVEPGIDDTAVNGETGQPISSNWAYDHAAAETNVHGGGIGDVDGDTKIQTEESADEDKIRFDTGGTERMIILADGKVGIGTTEPQTALHIATNVGSGVKLERGTLDARWWGASGGPAYFGTISNDALNFQTNNLNRMTIDSGATGGRVGIGTTSPDTKLHVVGDITVTGNVDGVDVSAHDTATTGVHGVGSYGIIDATTAAVTLYVDAGSGSDGNAGTSGSPKATIQGALDALPVVIAHACTIKVRGQQNYAESNTALDFSRLTTLATVTIKAVNSSDEDMYFNGQATGVTNTTLTDTGSGWSVNQFQDAYVWIVNGTGEGQIRAIISNTSDTLTISSGATDWTTNPTNAYFAIGGGATMTGTGIAHAWATGKLVDFYGLRHTGATIYDIRVDKSGVINVGNNYFATSVRGVFCAWLGIVAGPDPQYNYSAATTVGFDISAQSYGVIRANVITGAAKGIRIYYMGMVAGSTNPVRANHIMNCTVGISLESGSGMAAASVQSFGAGGDANGDDILPDPSTTIPQWYT